MSFLQIIYPGDAFMPAGITALLQVTVVSALALLLLRSVGHRNAARQHAIGVSAMLIVLLSPLLAWYVTRADLGLVSIKLAHPQSAIASVQGVGSPAAMNSVSWSADPVVVGGSEASAEGKHGAPTLAPKSSVSAVEISTRDMRARIFGALCGLWVLGVVLAFLRLIYGAGYQYAFCKTGVPIDLHTYRVSIEDVAERLGAPTPAILLSKLVDVPVAVGLLKPRVILPAALPEKITPRQLEDVLVHECAHVIRGDLWVGLAQRLAAMLFWFHPLVHILNRRIALTREELCDNYALASTKPAEYAQTLFDVTNSIEHIHAIPATAALIPPVWNLEQRIKGLLDKRRSTMTRTSRWITISVTAGFIAVAALTGVQDSAAMEGGSTPQTHLNSARQRTRTMPEATRDLSGNVSRSDIEKKLDTIIIPEVNLRQANMKDVTTWLQEQSQIHDVEEDEDGVKGVNLVYLAPAEGSQSDGPFGRADALSASKAPLVTFRARDISLRTALKLVTELAGFTYRIEDNVIVVHPSPALEEEGGQVIMHQETLAEAADHEYGEDQWVLIEVIAFTVELDEDVPSGADWVKSALRANGEQEDGTARATDITLAGTFILDSLRLKNSASAALRTALVDPRIKVVSSPVIRTRDGESAVIDIATHPENFLAGEMPGNAVVETPAEVDDKDAGYTLKLTPQINEDKNLMLKLLAKYSPKPAVPQGVEGNEWTQGSLQIINLDQKMTFRPEFNTESGHYIPSVDSIVISGDTWEEEMEVGKKSRKELVILLTPHLSSAPVR